jgi:hypothetical protein
MEGESRRTSKEGALETGPYEETRRPESDIRGERTSARAGKTRDLNA